MKKQKELLIIMPAYNEEKNIEAVLYELEKLGMSRREREMIARESLLRILE